MFSSHSVYLLHQSLCYVYQTLTVSRQHHTQLQYIHRLENIKDSLEMLTIDGLNEKRFEMPRYLTPVLYRYTKRGRCLRRRNEEEEDKPELGDPRLDEP